MKAKSVRSISGILLVLGCGVLLVAPCLYGADPGSFVAPFNQNRSLTSTVPANGDVNPYGVAVVKRTVGSLTRNHVLVSNFNNSDNLQGTGTTIMDISPDGKASVFAQLNPADLTDICPDGIGLTTALVVLRSGWVIVGSLPATYDQSGNLTSIKAGCLLVLDSNGEVVESIGGDAINGPWDMTAVEGDGWAVLFVTNVLNGTVAAGGATVNEGNVLRINLEVDEDTMPEVTDQMVIASGFGEKTDPAALVIGPTGVGFSPDGNLYVADTLANRIAAIPDALSRTTDAGTGETVFEGGALNGPLGLAVAPNGHILTVNSGDGNLVEITPDGNQVAVMNIDTTETGAGTLFGLALGPGRSGIYFVNDGNNTLNRLF
jgi:hypothetical protein